MRASVGFACVGLMTLAVFPLGARQQDDAAPVFKAESELVVLHVNVFDGHSDAVPESSRAGVSRSPKTTPRNRSRFSATKTCRWQSG